MIRAAILLALIARLAHRLLPFLHRWQECAWGSLVWFAVRKCGCGQVELKTWGTWRAIAPTSVIARDARPITRAELFAYVEGKGRCRRCEP